MFALGSILITVGKVLSMILTVYTWIIIGAVIISWVNPDPYNPIVRFLRQVTEPVFMQVRRFLPRAMFRIGIDFTPLIVLILIVVIQQLVVGSLYHYGQKLAAGS
ncbi:MAG: YggT family protein [bacterium]|nr:YggT family protein [bacterium]